MSLIITEQPNIKFRPSNWAERLAGNFASFKNRRLEYSLFVYPVKTNEQTAVMVDDEFKSVNPNGYVMLMMFADNNGLVIQQNNTDIGDE